MGYRSNVVFGIKKTVFQAQPPKLKEHFKDCDEITESNGFLYFNWDGVKWYEDYENVKEINNFMAKLDGENLDKEVPYGFLRTGEDDDDIERKGDSYGARIYCTRVIDFPEGVDVDKDKLFAPNSIRFIKEN